ncbi:MAG: hypothetical protein ABW078_00360 [Sedimenticola sp.]
MIGPISNDKITSQGSSTNSTANDQRVEKELASENSEVESANAPRPAEETVEVSAAGQLLNRTQIEAGTGSASVESADDARDLVGRLRRQIEQNAEQTLGAQGGLSPNQIAAILEAAPA